MKPHAARATACLAAAWAVAAPAAAEPQAYAFDPANSFVHFELLHFGTSTIRGRFGPITGTVMLDRAAGRGELSLRVPTTTVDTGLGIFNARIRQDDLLATEAWPEAYFVASRFRFEGREGRELAEVRGEFTLRGVSQPLSLFARHFACRAESSGGQAWEVCGGDFEAELTRSDFGISFGLPFVANRVRLQVQVEGRRALAPEPK